MLAHARMDALACRPIGHPWRTRWRHGLASCAGASSTTDRPSDCVLRIGTPVGDARHPAPVKETQMPDVLSRQDGPVLEIILNRPDRGNGADDAMAIELTRLIKEAPSETKCIILRGAGADFCTGRVAAGPPPTGPG